MSHSLLKHFQLLRTLAASSLFAVLFFLALFFGKWVTTFGLALYDFLLVCVLLIQIILLWTKRETVDELKVIMVFHLVGFVLEVFKTHPSIGSWSYPGEGRSVLWGVPLYSGFMYSAVGSFLFQAWERLQVRFLHFPDFRYTIPIGVLIYVNFFTHHFWYDVRWVLFVLIVLVSYRTQVVYKVKAGIGRMHVLLGLLGAGASLWLAENIATYGGAWMYPYQDGVWHMVSLNKIGSWFLLFIISFIIVSLAKRDSIVAADYDER